MAESTGDRGVNLSVEKKFKRASRKVFSLTERPDDTTMLRLYALYKQATEGDVSGRLPVSKGMVAIAKWKAWKGVAGTSEADAMERYCEIVDSLMV